VLYNSLNLFCRITKPVLDIIWVGHGVQPPCDLLLLLLVSDGINKKCMTSLLVVANKHATCSILDVKIMCAKAGTCRGMLR
jgi:hypothetical protein